jgi:ABC-type transporter Mla subunit MlaD
MQLGQLSDSLHGLLASIKAGEWERFAELAEKMSPAMDAVQSAAIHRKFNSADHRSKIEAVLAMLETAIHECSTRKEQLSPLIDALNRVSAHASPP